MSQREIKFRAWDGERMIYVEKALHLCLWNDTGRIPWGVYSQDGTRIADGQYNAHIMQYTGLKDKNGKEIYEGDICVATYTASSAGPYTNAVKWESGACGWSFANAPLWTWEGMRVIGNIHENPELLTP